MHYLAPIMAFLLGSIPFGLLIAKSQGINIREHGSRNIGATNVLRVVGKKYGITCFLLDFLKGIVPTVIGMNICRYDGQGATMLFPFMKGMAVEMSQFNAQGMHILTGLFAVLGHNYSPWVGFKGGKGVATSAGVITALAPFALPILGLIWFLLFKITRYVSLASIIASLCLPIIVLYGSWHHGKLQDGTWNKPLLMFAVLIGLMSVWKHRSNIQRLLNGSENKFEKKKKS